LHYLYGTLDKGVIVNCDSSLSLHAFSDVNWAGDKDDYSSTSAYIVYFGCHPISWNSKKQKTIVCTSTEAEYRYVVATATELKWLCYLLIDPGIDLSHDRIIYCDNIRVT
jgi:hypothetical protein